VARLKKRRSVVDEANETVLITTACRAVGMDIPEDLSQRHKIHCPFGAIYHSDQGLEPTMRIYLDSNAAHCFSRCGRFTPVNLAAMAWGIPRRVAARELLERAGRRSLSLTEAFAQAAQADVEPDRTLLGEALKTFCARVHAGWDDAQFDPGVAPWLTKCLALLDLVRTPDEAAYWLDGCKKVMQRALNGGQPSAGD
jgi:hypothetical protein